MIHVNNLEMHCFNNGKKTVKLECPQYSIYHQGQQAPKICVISKYVKS